MVVDKVINLGVRDVVTVQQQGQAFENWTFDVLRPYISKLNATNWSGNPDFYFDLNDHAVLLECKCFSFREKNDRRPRYLSLRKSQIDALRKMKNGLGGDNEIYLIVGILFSQYDMHPVVVELEEAISRAKRWKHADGRKFVSMEVLMRQRTLRTWMSEMFKVKPEHIQFPEWRAYLR